MVRWERFEEPVGVGYWDPFGYLTLPYGAGFGARKMTGTSQLSLRYQFIHGPLGSGKVKYVMNKLASPQPGKGMSLPAK